jgi:hypothetical protein
MPRTVRCRARPAVTAANPSALASTATPRLIHRECTSPALRLGHFADFVFRNFYPALWASNSYLHGLPRKDWGQRTVTSEEASRIHLHWSTQP